MTAFYIFVASAILWAFSYLGILVSRSILIKNICLAYYIAWILVITVFIVALSH